MTKSLRYLFPQEKWPRTTEAYLLILQLLTIICILAALNLKPRKFLEKIRTVLKHLIPNYTDSDNPLNHRWCSWKKSRNNTIFNRFNFDIWLHTKRKHDPNSCLNFWDEAWWFLSLRVFGLLSSSLLLFLQRFDRYVPRSPSGNCCLNFWDEAWSLLSLRVFFIFIGISTTFRSICPPAFFRCFSTSGTFTIQTFLRILYPNCYSYNDAS